MSFAIFSDSSCNLPKAQLEEFQVQIISSSYEREGKLITCPPYPEDFDGHEYYNFLRNKGVVKTSLIPAARRLSDTSCCILRSSSREAG